MPPPSSLSRPAMPEPMRPRANLLAMLGRHQARKDLHAAGSDGEVVVAAAEGLGAVLDHAQPPALAAVVGRHLLQPDHAVGDAVHGLVVASRRSDRRAAAPSRRGARNSASAPGSAGDSAASSGRAAGSPTANRARCARPWCARPPRRSAWWSRRARDRRRRAGSAAGRHRAGFPGGTTSKTSILPLERPAMRRAPPRAARSPFRTG